MNPIRLKIQWAGAVELIRLQKDTLPAKSIRTEEDWLDGSKLKVYNPRVAFFESQVDGFTRIELEYLQADHPDHDGVRVIWGKSTIRLSEDWQTASVQWQSYPPREDDGDAPCQVSEESIATQPEREAVSRLKRAQAKFKTDLLQREDQCAASGESLEAVLEAAHLQDVEYLGPNIPENGMLLRADLHKLFDDGYFSITEDGRWEFHGSLPLSYRSQFQSAGLPSATYERVKGFIPKRRPRDPSEKI